MIQYPPRPDETEELREELVMAETENKALRGTLRRVRKLVDKALAESDAEGEGGDDAESFSR